MKYFKILTLFVCIAFLSTYDMQAQDKQLENKSFAKTTTELVPQKVKDAAMRYNGYYIRDVFVGAEKSNAKVYKVVLFNGKSSFAVLVDRKGKIIKTLE